MVALMAYKKVQTDGQIICCLTKVKRQSKTVDYVREFVAYHVNQRNAYSNL